MVLIDGVASDRLPSDDRGLAYGHGVFETMLMGPSGIAWLGRHLQRLRAGLKALQIIADMSLIRSDLEKVSGQVLRRAQEQAQGQALGKSVTSTQIENAQSASESTHFIVKIIVTAGSGGRGYLAGGDESARRIVTVRPHIPQVSGDPGDGLTVGVLEHHLPSNPAGLPPIKHLNRLDQVLAAREVARRGWQDALLGAADQGMDHGLIEGVSGNLFILEDGRLITPPLNRFGVAGILRSVLLEDLPKRRDSSMQVAVEQISLARVLAADGIILCNAVRGLQFVQRLEVQTQTHLKTLPEESELLLDWYQKHVAECAFNADHGTWIDQ